MRISLRGLRRKYRQLTGAPEFPEEKQRGPDFVLHEYSSYEEYREVQIRHNKRKIEKVWADEKTLDCVVDRVQQEYGDSPVQGLCHGARNGFEQGYLGKQLNANVIGTDISDTANNFPNSVEWDFHDQNPEWLGKFHFLYTNSLDQSWKPKDALATWLDQLVDGGLLFIEHTDAHGPYAAGEMDPFGVRPTYMPYVLSDWFGHRISMEIITTQKSNRNMKAWVFVVKKCADKQ